MRFNKVVAELIHKDLVACINCASGNDLAAVTKATRQDVEIMTERIGRGVHEKILSRADQSRKRKEEEHLLRHDFKNLIVLA